MHLTRPRTSGSRTGRARIRTPRRPLAVVTLAALALAALTSGSTTLVPRTPSGGSAPASAGRLAHPADHGGSVSLGPCKIGGAMGVQMSEGLPTAPGYARSTGTVHALTLMIDFPDAEGRGNAMSRYDEFFPQTADWYRTSSYGRLDYRPDTPVKHWLRMPKPFTAYGIQRGSPYEPGYRDLARDIVKAARSQVDFRKYDLVNVIATPNAGPSALDTVLSVTFSGNDEAPVTDGVRLSNMSFIYSRQDDGSGSYDHTGYRVLPHENGHDFGLPDLYTSSGGGSVGHWDIMSEDWGADNDMLGWHKWKLGWLDDSQVSCASTPGTHQATLSPLETRGGTKLAVIPMSESAAYVLEVRTRSGNDDAVCRAGVLVYRVDGDVDTGQGPITVKDSTPDSSGCTMRPNVQAELSDAPFMVGQTFTDAARGVIVAVTGKDKSGRYEVRITRS
ncbi:MULTISPECIES: M6 family metalloprotease domain-containing protein [unclassified Streptomyces]|uniref:M6 family metalloprotease domain-containing protein n=1 Tax=unclassified Streptomyces TaxID=2593676 RepID=UPI00224EED79|nr:M6 family metalloprotease domain-containing protein [Streptomyces sp. NBC_01500]MCX4550338.1 M6 family metalloprotease domain-containing protein [Streptomyces sp. NBC_01500]WSV55784.1 M6 family metalloprotease domain-containing protein [Streptomyces sp. NBC_01014]